MAEKIILEVYLDYDWTRKYLGDSSHCKMSSFEICFRATSHSIFDDIHVIIEDYITAKICDIGEIVDFEMFFNRAYHRRIDLMADDILKSHIFENTILMEGDRIITIYVDLAAE